MQGILISRPVDKGKPLQRRRSNKSWHLTCRGGAARPHRTSHSFRQTHGRDGQTGLTDRVSASQRAEKNIKEGSYATCATQKGIYHLNVHLRSEKCE